MNRSIVIFGFVIALLTNILPGCKVIDRFSSNPSDETIVGSQYSTRLVMPKPPENLPPILERLNGKTMGVLSFPTKHAYDFSVLLKNYKALPDTTGLGHLYLPENIDKPVPAMIVLHGSGGIKSGREHEYAKLFTKSGIAGFVVDYYTPRGVTEATPYLMKTMIATEIDVLVDAYSALNFLASHPSINANRIGVIGFSYGGMATRFALDERVAKILAPNGNRFVAHADFYGPCHQVLGQKETTEAAYLAVFGDQDNSVHPETCARVHSQIRMSGSPTRIEIIKGAGHAWENNEPRRESPSPYIRGCEFSFDTVSGNLLIDGIPPPAVDPNADLSTRMNLRSQLSNYVQTCLKHGYIIGKDIEADRRAKAILFEFLSEHL